MMAFFLLIPKSIKVLVDNSTIEISDVNAAKNNARKKSEAKKVLIRLLSESLVNNTGR